MEAGDPRVFSESPRSKGGQSRITNTLAFDPTSSGISKQKGEKFHTNLNKKVIFNILHRFIVSKNTPNLSLEIGNGKVT